MRARSENRWVRLRTNAIEMAEQLAWRTDRNLPTNLGKIAALRGVHSIEFRPLLTDGGIALKDEGFVIYVKSDPAEGEYLTALFGHDGIGVDLPSRLVRRARFTIAHEIAHTLFYNTESKPPKPTVELKSAGSVRSLERACNLVAGTLLLPECILESRFARLDLSLPAELTKLTDAALVSKHALVMRLREFRRFPHPNAIVACVKNGESGWIIDSISRHYSLGQLFERAKEGSQLTTLVNHPDFIPNGGDLPEVDTELKGASGYPLKIRFKCDHNVRSNSRGSIFVTAVLST